MNAGTTALSSDFWDRFVEDIWGKKPAVFQNVFARPFLTETELIEAIQAIQIAIFNGRSVRMRGYRDGHTLTSGHQLLGFVPRPGVSTLDAYAAGVTEDVPADEFGVTVDNLEAVFADYLPAAFWRARDILEPLFERIGVSTVFDAVLLLGNYRYSPFGIHRDSEHVFAFPIARDRTVLVWPPDRFAEGRDFLPRSRRGQSHNVLVAPQAVENDAVALAAGPCDMMYWPAGWWHCGVSNTGRAHAMVALGVSSDLSPTAALVETLAEVLTGLAERPWELPAERSRAGLPPEADAALARISNLVSTGELRRRVESATLKHASARGMLAAPPLAPAAEVKREDAVRSLATCPILMSDDGGRVFANGHEIAAAFSGSDRIVSRLRSPDWLAVEALCDDPANTPRVLALLSALLAAGAVERRSSQSSV